MFKWNDEKHTYEITSVDAVNTAINRINEIANVNMVIASDADLKVVKANRTELNNLVKEISSYRKQMTALVLSQFAPQMIEVEKYGAKIANDLSEKIDAYVGKTKEETYKITIKTADKNALDKIIKLAQQYGCEVKEG